MSQHDMTIGGTTGAQVRAEIDLAIQAINSGNSGSAAPLWTAAYLRWADTTTGYWQQRNSVDGAWDEVEVLDNAIRTSAVGSDAYAITLVPAINAYADGVLYRFRADVANAAGATFNVNAVAAKTLKKWVNGVLSALETGDIIANQLCFVVYDATADAMILLNPSSPTAGQVIQVVSSFETDYAFGTTVMPNDDSIPQNTEGDEYFTLAITPKKATNVLYIEVFFNGSASVAANSITVAVFQDTTAGALVSVGVTPPLASYQVAIPLCFSMVAGVIVATTFKVRAGINTSGACCLNGVAVPGRLYGGVYYSGIKITEIEAT
jgi:hypothetical protein